MLVWVVFSTLLGLSTCCFCPSLISSSCGCGGGGYNSYAGGGYGGGGYATSGGSPGYATFYRDLTPFIQPRYQVPAYPQYYPRAPAPALPPMYPMPNPQYIRPPQQPQYVQRPAPAVVHPTLVHEPQVYIQPAATVAPIADIPRTTLHDNGYGEDEIVVTTARTVVTAAPVAPVDEVPDFVDEVPTKAGEKKEDEFYYAYYDDKGNKVGDSRSGTTFAPENVIVEEVTTMAPAAPVRVEVTTTKQVQEEVNENYDDIVEESQAPIRTSLATNTIPEFVTSTTILFREPIVEVTTIATGTATEVIYEDETVEYEDEGQEVAAGPVAKKPTSSGGYKRTVQDNQILVEAAETTGEGGYRGRVAGVKIVKRYRNDKRKIHEN